MASVLRVSRSPGTSETPSAVRNRRYRKRHHARLSTKDAAFRAEHRDLLRQRVRDSRERLNSTPEGRALFLARSRTAEERKRTVHGVRFCVICGNDVGLGRSRICGAVCKKLRDRDNYLVKTYGITAAQYDEQLARQDGKCAICQKPAKNRRLHVDHDHKKKGIDSVRGLICWDCNVGLGKFHDKVNSLTTAIAYLIAPPFQAHRNGVPPVDLTTSGA